MTRHEDEHLRRFVAARERGDVEEMRRWWEEVVNREKAYTVSADRWHACLAGDGSANVNKREGEGVAAPSGSARRARSFTPRATGREGAAAVRPAAAGQA